jgi:ribonuclease HII
MRRLHLARLCNRLVGVSTKRTLATTTSPIVLGGVDEAGRGPILGPLVIAACFLTPEAEEQLKGLGVKDSKDLSKSRREELYEFIRSKALLIRTQHLSPQQIDDREGKNMNLNQLQLETTVSLLRDPEVTQLTNGKQLRLYLDSVDVNSERYAKHFKEHFPNADIHSHHQAESKFTVVAAASIIAKVERDQAMKEAEKKAGIPIGSGYPSDADTVQFLKLYRNNQVPELAHLVRKTWKVPLLL